MFERSQFMMMGLINQDGVLDFQYKSLSPKRIFKDTVNLLDDAELAKRNYSLVGPRWFKDNERKPNCGPFKFTFYAFDLKIKTGPFLIRN